MNKLLIKLILLSVLTFSFVACGSKYNKIKFKDPNEGDKEIYGNIGGEPTHVSNPSKPDPAVGEISKPSAPKFREQIEATIQH